MRSVVTRLKVRCNLTEESPALSYWLYRRPLPVMLKDDTTNKKQKGKRTDKMPTLRKIKRAAKPSTSQHNLQHI